MNRPIYNMLKLISTRRSLHMPAHFGKAIFDYGDIFSLDTTEIDKSDNLYDPKSAIKEAQELLAKSACVKDAFFLHDGSSAGIRAMILYARHFGRKIIVPRLSHKSIYNAIAIFDMEPVFVYPSYTEDLFAYISTQNVINIINSNTDATAVIITSPDYYGVCVDIEKIASVAHKYGIIVLCDQAHGAHLNWSNTLKNAGFYGADVFVQSAHKTLPCLTSNAWLLNNNANHDLLLDCLQAVQTSSPSFINMMCMDDARAYMDENAYLTIIQNLIQDFSKKLKGFNLSHNIWEKYKLIFDETRLVIDCGNKAHRVYQILSNNGIDIEMYDKNRIVCILSVIPDICRYQLELLLSVLNQIEYKQSLETDNIYMNVTCQRALSINKAYFAEKELVDLEKSEGRISATIAGLYPPGIPLISWGELINKDLINLLKEHSNNCFGINDSKIYCVVEENNEI